MYNAINLNTIMTPDIYDSCLDAIKQKILEAFHIKKASSSAIKRFFNEFNLDENIKEIEFHKAILELSNSMGILTPKKELEIIELFNRFQDKRRKTDDDNQMKNDLESFSSPKKAFEDRELEEINEKLIDLP